MQIHTIELKPFKTIYLRTILINLVMVIGAFVLVKTGYTFHPVFDAVKNLARPIISIIILVAFAQTFYHQKKLKKIQAIEDFDEKLADYFSLYKSRIYWYFFTCMVSCIFYTLTGNKYFFYLAVLDTVLCLPFYPSGFILKRDLKNEEILFIR